MKIINTGKIVITEDVIMVSDFEFDLAEYETMKDASDAAIMWGFHELKKNIEKVNSDNK